MALEKTLVLLKPCTVQRALMGEILSRFEKKGLRVCGLKMMQLTDEVLSEHYAHLAGKEFFQRVKDSMMVTPRCGYSPRRCRCCRSRAYHHWSHHWTQSPCRHHSWRLQYVVPRKHCARQR